MAWEDVRLFLAVCEARSLTGAAKAVGLAQPTLSRRISQLEDRVGYPLFRRLAGGVAPTLEAERLVGPARRMAEWAGEISRAAAGGSAAPDGLVRIAAPPGVAFDFLTPFAAWLRGRLPTIRLEILSSVAYVDLVRGEADLALRMRGSTSPDLKVVATLHHEVAAFASAAYVKRLRRGYSWADIDWIAWAAPFENLAPNPQLAALVPRFRPVFSSDNYLVQWRAAEAGLGAMFFGAVKHRFARGPVLRRLALDLGAQSRSSLHLVCARSSLQIPRVRLVAEALAEELARVEQRERA